MDELEYKEAIEAIRDDPEFEAKGDALFLHHEDERARMEWAFYRPSGSHPDQVSDHSPLVSIMAFNHSRLGAYERFKRVHQDIIAKESLRIKIRNRSRMLFRAMVDNDLTELVEVLAFAPVFLEVACDQMVNGRIWNDTYADLEAASRFAGMVEVEGRWTEMLEQGIVRRLQPVESFNYEEGKEYLSILVSMVQKLHSFIKAHYVQEYERWLLKLSVHPLQRIALQKLIDLLKE